MLKINKILKKTDKWSKVFLYWLGQIIIFAFTIMSIFFISTDEIIIKDLYGNNLEMINLVLQMKNSFIVLVWFLIPISLILIAINMWKIYTWLYEKKENKRNGKRTSKNSK